MSAKNTDSRPNMPDGSDGADAPLDPAVEKVRRKVMRLMGISIAIMMVGLMAVFGAIFYKISTPAKNNEPQVDEQNASNEQQGEVSRLGAAGSDFNGNIVLPQGSTIVDSQLSQGQILLNVRSSQGQTSLWVYDIATKRVFAKIAIEN